jgi:hypothetical protein
MQNAEEKIANGGKTEMKGRWPAEMNEVSKY